MVQLRNITHAKQTMVGRANSTLEELEMLDGMKVGVDEQSS